MTAKFRDDAFGDFVHDWKIGDRLDGKTGCGSAVSRTVQITNGHSYLDAGMKTKGTCPQCSNRTHKSKTYPGYKECGRCGNLTGMLEDGKLVSFPTDIFDLLNVNPYDPTKSQY
jgi:hypothetical protein